MSERLRLIWAHWREVESGKDLQALHNVLNRETVALLEEKRRINELREAHMLQRPFGGWQNRGVQQWEKELVLLNHFSEDVDKREGFLILQRQRLSERQTSFKQRVPVLLAETDKHLGVDR